MKPGKDYLLSLIKRGSVNIFYFEPGKKYSMKKFLLKDLLQNLKGEIRIVDPYCGERTLDILRDLSGEVIKFLTRIENLHESKRKKFLRELEDFKTEFTHVEFRSYPGNELHDRYLISKNQLIIFGHSLKDLGNKESFAIMLDRHTSSNIFEALIETFNRRWKRSTII